MAAIIIDTDRSWRVLTNPISTPHHFLTTHLDPHAVTEPIGLVSNLALWTGATGAQNSLASGLLTYLGRTQFVFGSAVVTANSGGIPVDLNARQIKGMVALMQLVAADTALQAQHQQAALTWAVWFLRKAQ